MPAMAVGRVHNYFVGAPGDDFGVTLAVMNLGDVTGVGTVTETVPAGAVASNFSLAPVATVTNADGSTKFTFDVTVGPRVLVPAEEEFDQWGYANSYALNPGLVEVSYDLDTTGMSSDRHVCNAPGVTYTAGGEEWMTLGSPLVLDLCAGE